MIVEYSVPSCTIGCGGFLNVYSLFSTRLLDSVDLFRGSRIHAIRSTSSGGEIIVFGGKHVALVNLNINSEEKVQ